MTGSSAGGMTVANVTGVVGVGAGSVGVSDGCGVRSFLGVGVGVTVQQMGCVGVGVTGVNSGLSGVGVGPPSGVLVGVTMIQG